ncbi:hypothetical protein AUK40_00750 [Candidatus Wirthbacteria bacterium CG2_30_54_11]|uniref:DUF5666 domain-containing protein n=1 Tax=Candidatus Wirthbacteria bacterium CG2_30_54_11 TaxID=1817892 RepID=A0A1J5IQH8_9BACT|nr:MAG: hypothetical protein AUK40_00750 [Candidatus Wirthbacteria bacterium CG2_30_54_11]
MNFERIRTVLQQKAEYFVAGSAIVGLIFGLILGKMFLSSPTMQQVNDTMFTSSSTAIVQRTLTVKGEIKEIVNKTITVVPAEADATQRSANQLEVAISSDSSVYLYLVTGDNKIQNPQKVELKDLRPGDEVEVILSQDQDGTVTTNTVSAHRSV